MVIQWFSHFFPFFFSKQIFSSFTYTISQQRKQLWTSCLSGTELIEYQDLTTKLLHFLLSSSKRDPSCLKIIFSIIFGNSLIESKAFLNFTHFLLDTGCVANGLIGLFGKSLDFEGTVKSIIEPDINRAL
jgi:hypothetical protein